MEVLDMYILNENYIKKEMENLKSNGDSEFINAILNYPKPLPLIFDRLFHLSLPNHWGIPVSICKKVQHKHSENLILHGRYEAFNKDNESFSECDDRLIQQLLDKTGLPIYIKVE